MKKLVLPVGVLLLVLSSLMAEAKPDHAKKKPKDLPPGLEKNVENGKPLPPGWQKKLRKGEVLSTDIYTRGRIVVPLNIDGFVTIEVQGTLLKLHDKTRRIIEILK